jgi:hypothetical protein
VTVSVTRIKGVSSDLAVRFRQQGISNSDQLLAAAGTPAGRKELAGRNPDHLYAALVKLNEEQALAGRHPCAKEVQGWIAQAKALPRALEY